MLLLEAGRPVSSARLIDELWNDAERAGRSLQVYVSELRRLMRDPSRIRSERGSYRLSVGPGELDAATFEGRSTPADVSSWLATRKGPPRPSSAGSACGEVNPMPTWPPSRSPSPPRSSASARSVPRRPRAGSTRSSPSADTAKLLREIEAFVAAEPLRERPRRQLMLALYRAAGRPMRCDAYRDARQSSSTSWGSNLDRAEGARGRSCARKFAPGRAGRASRSQTPPGPGQPNSSDGAARSPRSSDCSRTDRGWSPSRAPGHRERPASRCRRRTSRRRFDDGVVFVGLATLA